MCINNTPWFVKKIKNLITPLKAEVFFNKNQWKSRVSINFVTFAIYAPLAETISIKWW